MILPKTTLEQRLPLYDDVESLLTVGFLSHPVEISGVLFQLRSLNPGDLFLLRSRVSGYSSNDKEWQYWSIASSIWMVDGWITLQDVHAPSYLYQKIKNLSSVVVDVLFNTVLGLHQRQTKAVSAAEAFCFEATSRYKWKSYLSGAVNAFTGIPGVERLGLNYVQQMWAVYNGHEDKRVDEENAWERAKLIASAQSPKGVKQIDEADRRRRLEEENRRQQIMDKFYYVSKGILKEGVDESDNSLEGPKYIQRTKSVEDLEKEMYDWVTGREDWHDKTVREYKEQVIAKYEQEKAEAEARAEMLRQLHEQQADTPVSLVGYTPTQLAQILEERGSGPEGARHIFEHPVREAVFQKYIAKKPTAGNLKVEDGKIAVGK